MKKNGRPPKDDKYTKTNKVYELKYIIARKEAKIKALEMENELMLDISRLQKGSESGGQILSNLSPQGFLSLETCMTAA